MKNVLSLSLFVSAVACASGPQIKASQLRDMEVTCYDDGESCPGGCDAHTVFKPAHNSTTGLLRNAYLPGTRSSPKACRNGEDCTICFSSDPSDCVTTIYRGDGPPVGRFDVTPKFLHEFCYYQGTLDVRSDVADGLREECADVSRTARSIASGKVNCIANPESEACRSLIQKAVSDWNADRPEFEKCLKMGEDAYNASVPSEKKRVYDCAYTKATHNVGGTQYHSLMPGACRQGTFVSPGGFDCCSADDVGNACSGDCKSFYR